MSLPALGLVLVAAFIHATWNYAAKRAGGGLPFVWISSTLALGLYVVVGTRIACKQAPTFRPERIETYPYFACGTASPMSVGPRPRFRAVTACMKRSR